MSLLTHGAELHIEHNRSTDYTDERAFSSYGLNLILGTDFFLIRNLYLGFEIGLGYEMTKYKQIELELLDNREPSSFYPTTSIDDKLTYPSSKSTNFGFYYNNSIRLGVYFLEENIRLHTTIKYT